MKKVVVGSLVMSTQGYDKNKVYVVKEINNKTAYLMDGKNRHFYKPKPKNLKHLKTFSLVYKINPDNVGQVNEDVYRLIKSFTKALKNL